MADAQDHITRLNDLLGQLDGRSFGAYKQLLGLWRLDNCDLRIDHVQGDPFAAPSHVALLVDRATAALPAWAVQTPQRRISTADFLLRGLVPVVENLRQDRGSGRSGLIQVTTPSQAVLARTAVQVHADGRVQARLRIGLPASGRRVLGRQAAALLLEDLPDVVEAALRADTLDLQALRAHIQAVEDQQWLRNQLAPRGLVAFVADGSLLPRRSGVDPRPMLGEPVLFTAPPSLALTLETPHAGPVRGMALAEGLTLIVGGGYHGKSTLLQALQLGVYDHIASDGRSRVVTRDDAVKVRAEDGRAVTDLDISLFIGDLPGGIDATAFTSADASGSTSQAAAIVEARAVGSRLLLIDEDTSATNLLVRDARMAALVGADKEPITPLVQRVPALRRSGCSLILVIGGTGDYFAQADTVVWMDKWRAVDATAAAHDIVAKTNFRADKSGFERKRSSATEQRTAETTAPPIPWRIQPLRINLRDHHGRLRVRVTDVRRISLGAEEIDLRGIDQLVAPGQALAAGLALELVCTRLSESATMTLVEALDATARRLAEDGLDVLSTQPRGDLIAPRTFEIAAIAARLRN